MSEATAYQLAIILARPARIRVGLLGVFDFPAGEYRYTGSARRGLEARIARHLRQEKALRWHVDYLLADAAATVTGVTRHACAECELNRRSVGTVLVPGFGASDCHAGCGSHLKYLAGDACA